MAWDNACPEEQQGETEDSPEGLAKLSSNRQDTLKELGRQICHFGAKVCKAFDDATPEQRGKEIHDGTTAFGNLSSELQLWRRKVRLKP